MDTRTVSKYRSNPLQICERRGNNRQGKAAGPAVLKRRLELKQPVLCLTHAVHFVGILEGNMILEKHRGEGIHNTFVKMDSAYAQIKQISFRTVHQKGDPFVSLLWYNRSACPLRI